MLKAALKYLPVISLNEFHEFTSYLFLYLYLLQDRQGFENHAGLVVYFDSIFKNLALIATITVLSDISTAPMAGLRMMPQANSTPAASGMATTL